MKKAAIYHFTDGTQRTKIYKKQLKILKEYATYLGYTDIEIYCDLSLLRKERVEFDRLLSHADQFDALIVKDFYHISKNTTQCVKIIESLKDNGVQIFTTDNGSLNCKEAPFKTPLRVATYCSRFGTKNEMKELIPVRNDILDLFAKKKTLWTIQEQYWDESKLQNNGEQKDLSRLIKAKNNYDLLLVPNMSNVHWRTANFCKIREALQLDIYSLEEGFLKYTGKETNI